MLAWKLLLCSIMGTSQYVSLLMRCSAKPFRVSLTIGELQHPLQTRAGPLRPVRMQAHSILRRWPNPTTHTETALCCLGSRNRYLAKRLSCPLEEPIVVKLSRTSYFYVTCLYTVDFRVHGTLKYPMQCNDRIGFINKITEIVK